MSNSPESHTLFKDDAFQCLVLDGQIDAVFQEEDGTLRVSAPGQLHIEKCRNRKKQLLLRVWTDSPGASTRQGGKKIKSGEVQINTLTVPSNFAGGCFIGTTPSASCVEAGGVQVNFLGFGGDNGPRQVGQKRSSAASGVKQAVPKLRRAGSKPPCREYKISLAPTALFSEICLRENASLTTTASHHVDYDTLDLELHDEAWFEILVKRETTIPKFKTVSARLYGNAGVELPNNAAIQELRVFIEDSAMFSGGLATERLEVARRNTANVRTQKRVTASLNMTGSDGANSYRCKIVEVEEAEVEDIE